MHNRRTSQQQNPRGSKSDRAGSAQSLARALVAPAAVALALVTTTLPALARDANAGDVWIDAVGQPAGPGHEHDPHLPCADLNLWGAKLADTAGTFTIDSWPPSGRQQQVYPSATTSATWQSTASRAPQIIAVIPTQTLIANAVAAGAHATHQGFHFKLQLSQDPQKHKTFWLRCAQPERPAVTAGGGPAGGGGPSGGGGASSGGGVPGGGGTNTGGGGAPGTSGTPGGGSAGGPGQLSGSGSTVSPGGGSTSLTRSTLVPRTLPNTGSPVVPHSSPYLDSLPLLVLGLLVTVRPRRWPRLVRGLRRPAAVR